MKSGEKSVRRYAIEESHKYYEEGFTILKEKLDETMKKKRHLSIYL